MTAHQPITPETAAAWIASLDTATAMDIIADALELTINAADEDNGGCTEAFGDHYISDREAIETVAVTDVHIYGDGTLDVFDVVDKVRARILSLNEDRPHDLARTTAIAAAGDYATDLIVKGGAA